MSEILNDHSFWHIRIGDMMTRKTKVKMVKRHENRLYTGSRNDIQN
jgi:hypothetical protein